jgi:xanthine dehydrogenase accessory factor
MLGQELLALAVELESRGEPFALATVVRCERPTSAKPGAKALVRSDGTLSGWVGGACAEPVVLREALHALRDGRPRLIALRGDGLAGPGRTEGIVEYPMTCHSGGTLEIYVEPFLPRPLLLLVGHGPVLEALEALGRPSGYSVSVVPAERLEDHLGGIVLTPRASVVVATHGDLDEAALAGVLASPAGYVSLVASRKRAAAVADGLARRGVPAHAIGRLRAPAGLDIGAVTPEEIAVSILAEIVQHHRAAKQDSAAAEADAVAAEAGEATDPICGMVVAVATARHRSEVAGRVVYFCCAGCKETFDADPERHLPTP